MAKLDSAASIEKIVSNTVVNGNETEKKTRIPREPKIDFNHDEVDLEVFRAILRATAQSIKDTLNDHNRSLRNGILISDLLLNLKKFSKVEATNRSIVKEAISSLEERCLVRSIDHGKFQYISATNGGHYYVADDGRVVTNFYTRNQNPLKVLFEQIKDKQISRQIHAEMEAAENVENDSENQDTNQEVTDFGDAEEYQEPEFEFAPDNFDDDGSELNSDTPEI